MRRFACFGGAPATRLASSSCLGAAFCDGLGPRAPHDGIFVPDSDIDADPTDGPGDDLDGELWSPLERSWPREPETWGRRSVISPHRALVAAPTTTPRRAATAARATVLWSADARPAPERRSSSDEDTPADGATRSVGSDLTRSSSSSSEEDDDAVTPLKLTTNQVLLATPVVLLLARLESEIQAASRRRKNR